MPEFGDAISYAPYKLSRTDRAIVGDIIMIGAEIDQLISVALFEKLGIAPATGFMVLGKTSIGTKIKYFCDLQTNSWLEKTKTVFIELRTFIGARNMFAHGTMVGEKDGYIGFLVTADPTYIDEDNKSFRLKRFKKDGFKNCRKSGRRLCRFIREAFGVGTLPEILHYSVQEDKPHRL